MSDVATPNYSDIDTFAQLKDYLLIVRPRDPSTHEAVLRYAVKSRPWPNQPGKREIWVDAVIKALDGSTYRKFYGYVDDVFHNINAGLLEPSGPSTKEPV